MPESRGRKKATYTPPRRAQKLDEPNPVWYAPVMVGLMLLGLLWVVVYYISGNSEFPVPVLHRWNLGVGFALMIAGFFMTTKWR